MTPSDHSATSAHSASQTTNAGMAIHDPPTVPLVRFVAVAMLAGGAIGTTPSRMDHTQN